MPLLEQSQGSRAPRNNQELIAQGYMLGNCAHCHNPRGYPTVQNPVLANVLDFLPSQGSLGGIFQFPLELYSPRIQRGPSGAEPIPYITPSLVDLPKTDPRTGQQAADWFLSVAVGNGGNSEPGWVDYAPWRSIIFRNVESVFAYTDDYALFPHMPMNTPGYDERAKQILGDWMVSIPAVRKRPDLVEYAFQTDQYSNDNVGSPVVDTSYQPYVEVLPGQPGYEEAQAAALTRLQVFHSGVNDAQPGTTPYSVYTDPGNTADIRDPAVLADPICHPIPTGEAIVNHTPLAEHPHWVVTDLTQPAGPYSTRQPNWPQVLVEQQIPPFDANSSCGAAAGAQAAYDDQVDAVGLLQTAALDQIDGDAVGAFATTPVPFGLWQQQPGCSFASQSTVQSFSANPPHWMTVTNPPADAPVYMQTPGASVFKMICINCHGPLANAQGRLAQNLATMTGGNALVADFRDGLFGPVGSTLATSNRQAVFGDSALQPQLGTPPGSEQVPQNWEQGPDGMPLTADDRAARYMAWMGLGGTAVQIPIAVLQLVAITKVLDQRRTLDPTQLSANMLSQAKALCISLLAPTNVDQGPHFDPRPGHGYLDATVTNLNSTLIPENGDLELWLKMCSISNPPPVHILQFPASGGTNSLSVLSTESAQGAIGLDPSLGAAAGAMVSHQSYPSGSPVGNESGGVDSTLLATNEWPWCADATTAKADQLAAAQASGIPLCPPSVSANAFACSVGHDAGADTCFYTADANKWAVRGAINAGMSVFTYVRSIEDASPPPDYTQCNLLK